MHTKMRSFEANWNAAIDLQVPMVECTRLGLPCSLHPLLCPVRKKEKGGEKVVRASMCNAREVVKRRFQEEFQTRLGLRCFFPEPQLGGNSNIGNVATRYFQNSKISAEILGVPEELLKFQWKLLRAVNSTEMQDITKYKENAMIVFDLWTSVYKKNMTANVHMLIAHGADYMKWAQEDLGVPIGVLTEGSIEVLNKDVKQDNKCFVARISSERVQRDIMVRRNWEADPLLHFEATVRQVIRSGNIYRKKNSKEDEADKEEVVDINNAVTIEDMVIDDVFGNEEDRMAMVEEIEEEWDGDEDCYLEELE